MQYSLPSCFCVTTVLKSCFSVKYYCKFSYQMGLSAEIKLFDTKTVLCPGVLGGTCAIGFNQTSKKWACNSMFLTVKFATSCKKLAPSLELHTFCRVIVRERTRTNVRNFKDTTSTTFTKKISSCLQLTFLFRYLYKFNIWTL